MSVRDKIAKAAGNIMFGDLHSKTSDGRTLELKAADAILATIKASVPELVWVERRNYYWDAKGTKYQIALNGCGTWRVRLDGKVIFRSRPSMEAAKAAARAHHVAQKTDWMGIE